MSDVSLVGTSVRLPGWVWTPPDRKTAWFCAILITLCLGFLIAGFWVDGSVSNPEPNFSGDFGALWSWAKIAFSHPAGELYDARKLHEAQVALGMAPQSEYPFPYPPTILLVLWPLRFLSYHAAYVAWVGVTLPLYLLAGCAGAQGQMPKLATMLLAPATTVCLVSGQSGFLLAALLVGGLRLLPRRPVLAGILFGLLTYKPQFGILLPLALVAARQWRCIAAACVTTVGLLLATIAVFGIAMWETWWRTLPGYAAWFYRVMAENQFIPTVLNNLQRLGVPQAPARAAQVAATLAAGIIVWRAWRKLPHSLAVPALLAAACLATPYAFVYDLPLLTSAVFLFAGYRLRSTASLVLPEVAVLVSVLVIPIVMAFRDCHLPISTVAVSLFLALIMSAGRGAERPGCDSGFFTQRSLA